MTLVIASFLFRVIVVILAIRLARRLQDRWLWVLALTFGIIAVLPFAERLPFVSDESYRRNPMEELDDFLLSDVLLLVMIMMGRLVSKWNRAAHQALTSEERYRGLMEQCADAVFLHSGGKFVYVNQAAADLLGAQTPAELIGLPVIDRVHPDYRERVRGRMSVLIRGDARAVPATEELLLRMDGTPVPAEISGTVCELDGAPAVQVVARDISVRKRAEQNLLESREVLEKAQAVAHVGSWVWTVGDSPELIWSAETFRIFGVDPAAFGGTMREFFDRVHPADAALVHAASESARKAGKTYSVDHRIVRPDGRVRWVHEEADCVPTANGSFRMIGAVQDITERKLAQDALEESELRYRQLFRLNPEPMWVYSTETRRFLAVNEASVTHYGYGRDEFLRMTVDELVEGEGGASAGNGDETSAPAHNGAARVIRHRRKDGSRFEVEIVGQNVPFIGAGARLVVARDVSEQRRSEALRAGHGRVLELAARGEPMETVLAALAETYNGQLDGAAFSVHLLNRDGTAFEKPVAPVLPGAYVRLATGFPVGEGSGPCGTAVALKRRAVTPDLEMGGGMPEQARQYLLDLGYRAYWAQPIIGTGDRAVGTIAAYLKEPGQPTAREAQLLESAASLAGVAIERRRAEEAVREANDRLRAIIWSSPLPIVAIDTEGRVRLWNGKAEEVFGWKEEEVLGQLAPMVSEERQGEFRNNLMRSLSGETIYELELRRQKRDGSPIDVSLSAAPLYGEDGEVTGVMAVFTDIGERKRTERALLESEERLEYAQQCAEAGTWDLDVATGMGRWSDAYFRLFGAEPVEEPVHADRWRNLIAPEDLERVRTEFAGLFAERSPVFRLEFRSVHPTRGVRWYTSMGRINYGDDGRPLRMAGITMDIDDRKRAQDAASEWSSRYEAAVRASRQLLYDWEPRTNRLVWGGNATEILGFGLGELGDLDHWLDLVHPNDRTALRAGIDRLISTREPFTLEHRVRRRDGQYIDVQDTGSYYADPAGGGARMIGFVSDITQRKRLEGELRQTQKLDAIGRLASGVSHDFNNLLTAIFGYTSLARRTLSPNHPATRALDRVDDAARQASGVTKSLLTFSRESRTEKRPINLARTVDEAVRLLRRTLPATVALHADLEQNPAPWVMGDPTQLQQTVINLAINARDAMPTGGTLKLELRRVDSGGRPVARLAVSDTGTGIPAEVMPRIFEPFFTTKAPGEGTGLGLAIIHGIVLDHGGKIEVRSEAGRGATFVIDLPVCGEALEEATAAKPTPAAAEGQGELIILGDDHNYVREIVSTMLQGMGFRVLQAADGGAALGLYRANRNRARLLLLDEDMPGCSGLGCVQAVRDHGDEIPAVIMASTTTPNGGELPRGTSVLRKPFQLFELSAAIASAMGHARQGLEIDT